MNQDSIRQLFSMVYEEGVDKVPFYVPVLEDNTGKNVLQSLL